MLMRKEMKKKNPKESVPSFLAEMIGRSAGERLGSFCLKHTNNALVHFQILIIQNTQINSCINIKHTNNALLLHSKINIEHKNKADITFQIPILTN